MTSQSLSTPTSQHGGGPQIALVDLLDRLLGAGVVVSGDLVISLAGVDLVEVRLHALITSVRSEMARATERGAVSGDREALLQARPASDDAQARR